MIDRCPASAPHAQEPMSLDQDAIADFNRDGYLIVPDFIDPATCDRLKDEVDLFVDGPPASSAQRQPVERRLPLEYQAHGRLITEERMMGLVGSLMGGAHFAMHHLHTARHDPGCPGVPWHHDYEQLPQSNRSHLMVHVFYYLSGLNGEVGDLMILPGSHASVMNRDALSFCGTGDLEGMRVIDRLTPGSAVIVHSALLHARRAKPGGHQRRRYFIDISYCQNGVRWPAYHNHEAIFARAQELGLGQESGHGYVFDPSTFFATDPVMERLNQWNQGSLAERLA